MASTTQPGSSASAHITRAVEPATSRLATAPRPDVGEGQHPAATHVAPEAIGGGLADRQEIRHVRGTRRKSRMRDGRVRPCLCRLTQTLS